MDASKATQGSVSTAQGYFEMLTGEAWEQTTDMLISRQPTLPLEPPVSLTVAKFLLPIPSIVSFSKLQ